MDIYIIIVFICLLLSMIIIFNFSKFESKVLNLIFDLLVITGILKYIALIIFYSIESPKYLYDIQFMPMLSLVSIFILAYIMIYFSKGRKLKIKDWVIIGIIFIIGIIIVFNFSEGIKNSEIGYELIKNSTYVYLCCAFKILLSIFIIGTSLDIVINFKKVEVKICNAIIIIAFIVLLIEEALFIINKEIFNFSILGDLSVLISIVLIFLVKGKTKTS